tara:strand:+ start:936 stop:1250 length:315 start_codon:yes stop_codon:yes gene_type:complete
MKKLILIIGIVLIGFTAQAQDVTYINVEMNGVYFPIIVKEYSEEYSTVEVNGGAVLIESFYKRVDGSCWIKLSDGKIEVSFKDMKVLFYRGPKLVYTCNLISVK